MPSILVSCYKSLSDLQSHLRRWLGTIMLKKLLDQKVLSKEINNSQKLKENKYILPGVGKN